MPPIGWVISSFLTLLFRLLAAINMTRFSIRTDRQSCEHLAKASNVREGYSILECIESLNKVESSSTKFGWAVYSLNNSFAQELCRQQQATANPGQAERRHFSTAKGPLQRFQNTLFCDDIRMKNVLRKTHWKKRRKNCEEKRQRKPKIHTENRQTKRKGNEKVKFINFEVDIIRAGNSIGVFREHKKFKKKATQSEKISRSFGETRKAQKTFTNGEQKIINPI